VEEQLKLFLQDYIPAIRYRPFALSLSKGATDQVVKECNPFMVRQAHHERIFLGSGWKINKYALG